VQGLACPLDGFEIVLFSLSGPDGKTYPLCPYCYNCEWVTQEGWIGFFLWRDA
jgi:hypothetical protein